MGTKDILIIDKDHGKVFTVSLAARFMVCLKENPTTGYQWEAETFDPEILELLETDYSESTKDTYGGGGEKKFVFRAKTKGISVIRMFLRHQWEKKESPLVHFEVTIKVD